MKASCLLHVHVGAAIADLSAAGAFVSWPGAMTASCLLGAAIAGAATGMASVGFGVRRRGGEGWLLSSGGFAESTPMLAIVSSESSPAESSEPSPAGSSTFSRE